MQRFFPGFLGLAALLAAAPWRNALASEAALPPAASRIVNGVVAQDRPTTGALLYSYGSNYFQAICSGTLIGCETFLTAAHCVCTGSTWATCGTPVAGKYSVYLQDVGILPVASIDVDPVFSFDQRGDLAVLKLSSPVTGVAPTPLNTSLRPPFGTTVDLAGYGLTRGGADDVGMLRRGLAETSACTAANPDYHVCWAFQDPLDIPGLESNTCNGDSGGPAFADLGFGESLVGITSGGSSGDCLPDDASFDTDVYVHRTAIEGFGGADLLNTRCGSIAQVGEAGATRTTFDFDTYTKSQQDCRKEFSKQMRSYLTAALRAWQSCLNDVADNSRPAPCPDAQAAAELADAEARVDAAKLAARCPSDVAPSIGATGACTGAADAQDLADCILAAGASAVDTMLASEYADDSPSGPIPNPAQRSCQRAVASFSAAFVKTTMKAVTRCQAALAAGKTPTCPDTKTSLVLSKAEAKFRGRVASECTNSSVTALNTSDPFGGSCAGAATVSALADCEFNDHEAARDGLAGLLVDQVMETDVTFPVPAGTSVLRVTLNGRDSGTNDLDLYVRAGAPATLGSYDAKSENGGMFEETEVASPAAGTWHAHVRRYSGDALIPYQISATAFQP